VSRRAGFAETPSQQDRRQSQNAAAFERRRRGWLHTLLGAARFPCAFVWPPCHSTWM